MKKVEEQNKKETDEKFFRLCCLPFFFYFQKKKIGIKTKYECAAVVGNANEILIIKSL